MDSNDYRPLSSRMFESQAPLYQAISQTRKAIRHKENEHRPVDWAVYSLAIRKMIMQLQTLT